MARCYNCGDEIVFRWVDGALRPIHVNGGWCEIGLRSGPASPRGRFEGVTPFGTVKSYLDPNARCPVCGASVYFYRSPYNGRVFFDDVGWPKHPCTDVYPGPDGRVLPPVTNRLRFHFRSRDGQPLSVYLLDEIIERANHLLIRLKSAERVPSIVVVIGWEGMAEQGIEITDIEEAPSLVLPRETGPAGETQVSFISARLQSVVVLGARVR